MDRRSFLAATAASSVAPVAQGQGNSQLRLGIDLFSIRSQGWSPFEYIDYCAKWKAQVAFFSEVRFLGGMEDGHLKKIRAHADRAGIAIETGMRSICPTSKAFDPKAGTAEQQLTDMIRAARILGSPVVRCFIGTIADRSTEGGIERHIESTVRVLRAMRARFQDADLKVAVENHAGDTQARELKMLVEEAGKDFVGICLDSGNPVWAIEDPHLTLEMLAPYALTSGVRDSYLWRAPDGVAVSWTRLGEGNVKIHDWISKFLRLCPGKTLALEILVSGPRIFKYMDPSFWDAYRKTPAWEFARFLALAEAGKPRQVPAVPKDQAIQREREDLEASVQWVQKNFTI